MSAAFNLAAGGVPSNRTSLNHGSLDKHAGSTSYIARFRQFPASGHAFSKCRGRFIGIIVAGPINRRSSGGVVFKRFCCSFIRTSIKPHHLRRHPTKQHICTWVNFYHHGASISCPLINDVQDRLTHPFGVEYKCVRSFNDMSGFITIEIQPGHHFVRFGDNLSF